MNKDELILYIVWFSVNLFACLSFAIPASKYFSSTGCGKFKPLKCFVILIGVYFIEGLAFGAGMISTNNRLLLTVIDITLPLQSGLC